MIFLAFILHFFQVSIKAAPLSSSSSFLERQLNFSGPGARSLEDLCVCQEQRSIYGIIWSCLATVFACSWLSIHPNIPKHGERRWKLALRRLELMIWSIIAPELIIMWAMRQWRGARTLARRYCDRGWTKTHGHFLQMGGFVLYSIRTGEPIHVLTYETFDNLLNENRIEMPRISEEDIQDRSKADGLSKAVVLVQTAWFIVQCIARRAQGLILTELELVTVSFAALNGVMYFLWWNKPLDVTSTFPVYLLESGEDGLDVNEHPPQMISQGSHLALSSNQNEEKDILEEVQDEKMTEKEDDGLRDDTSRTESKNTQDEPHQQQPPSTLLRIIKLLLILPYHLVKWPLTLTGIIYRRLLDMSVFSANDSLDLSKEKHVPAFYAVPDADFHTASPDSHSQRTTSTFFNSGWPEMHIIAASAAIGILFGGIHCVGWSSTTVTFPTLAEQKLWHICSLIITIIPGIALLFHPLTYLIDVMYKSLNIRVNEVDDEDGNFEMLVSMVAIPLVLLLLPLPPAYIGARLALLVQSVVALRDIPPEAYAQIEWIALIPHV